MLECLNTPESKPEYVFSECNETQEVVRDAKESLQDILNAMDDGVALVGLDGRVLDCNEATLKLLGLTREEFIGTNVYDIVVPEDRQRAIEGAFKVLETGKVLNQVDVLRKNGSAFCAEISVTALYDKNKKPVIFVGVTRDVTERKKMEAELKENEQLYRTLFDNSEDGFMLIEPIFGEIGKASDFRFLKLNSAYERQTGAKADVLGKTASEVTLDLEPEITLLSGDVVKTGKPIHHEAYNKYSNKWYDSYFFPYAEGQVGILFRDITDRKKTEGDLKNSEENYRVYVESSPVPFFVINSERRYVQVNDAACKLLGYSEKELLKMTTSDIVFEEDQLLARKQLTTLEETGKAIAEFRLKRKDGQAVYVILNAVKLSDGKSMAFCENITELKNLEKQLRDKERLAAVGATAGMVGHDIRNPLQSIVSSLYLIKNDLDNFPDSEEKNNSLMELGSILEEIDYADKIVSDLQDYTRPLKPELVEANIKTLVTGALSTLNVPNNVEAGAFFDEKLPKLRTDPAIMKRVLLNLAINALQAMPEGGKLTIRVSQDKETSSFIIRVEDTGIGIPKDVQNKLFTPLFTTKAKGQGFGLAVVKRLTESLGGTVTFESQGGKGTTFIIRLPQFPPKS